MRADGTMRSRGLSTPGKRIEDPIMLKPPPLDELGLARQGSRTAPWKPAAFGVLVGAVVVGAVWALLARVPLAPAPSAPGVFSEDGEIQVRYMIQTSPTGAEGSTIDNAAAIEFYPGYVVVKRRDGSGTVFTASHTRELYWNRRPKAERTPSSR
jgi:hypothetical protein